jgi:hypothetical protein
VVAAGCGERCRITASGRVRIGGRAYPLRPAVLVPRGSRPVRTKLLLTPAAKRALKRALARDRAVSARIGLQAEDPTGNASKLVARTVRVTG